MKRKINLLIVGTASRSQSLIGELVKMPDVHIAALSDLLPERMEKAAKIITDAGHAEPVRHADYRALLDLKGLDAVIAAGSWDSHIPVCLDAMKAGLYAASEVGCASSLDECRELVRTSENTGKPCMMLENCCYGKDEMMIGRMIREGLFGEIVSAGCGYQHDLRVLARQPHPYRMMQNLRRCGDLYLTHGLGPVCQWLGINRGNRILSVVSMSSKSRGFESWIREHLPEDDPRREYRFANGDVTDTLIRCANGETIRIRHTITLPAPYSRHNELYGTGGVYSEDSKGISLDSGTGPQTWTPIEKFYRKYSDPLWIKFERSGKQSGHGGMDYLVLRAFIEAVKQQKPTPISVYDTALWMAVSVLSEQSVLLGSSPVAMPDFTGGTWIHPAV